MIEAWTVRRRNRRCVACGDTFGPGQATVHGVGVKAAGRDAVYLCTQCLVCMNEPATDACVMEAIDRHGMTKGD